MGTLQINMLGTSFSIKSSEDEAYLNKLLGYYKKIVDAIEENGMMHNQMQIAIMAGIMLCDELYKEKSKTAKITQNSTICSEVEAEKLAEDMIRKLDEAINIK